MTARRRNPQPLGPQRLEELALAYVARFATTRAKLEGYLARKLRERGWDDERPPDPQAIAQKMVDAGYVDDASYARSRKGSLLRRGYGERRIGEALRTAGVDEDLRQQSRPSGDEARQAAVALARRRRLGPFAAVPPDRPARDRQLAALLRAGHGLDIARRIMDLHDPDEAQAWADSPAD